MNADMIYYNDELRTQMSIWRLIREQSIFNSFRQLRMWCNA